MEQITRCDRRFGTRLQGGPPAEQLLLSRGRGHGTATYPAKSHVSFIAHRRLGDAALAEIAPLDSRHHCSPRSPTASGTWLLDPSPDHRQRSSRTAPSAAVNNLVVIDHAWVGPRY
jgi:hypothetical protein